MKQYSQPVFSVDDIKIDNVARKRYNDILRKQRDDLFWVIPPEDNTFVKSYLHSSDNKEVPFSYFNPEVRTNQRFDQSGSKSIIDPLAVELWNDIIRDILEGVPTGNILEVFSIEDIADSAELVIKLLDNEFGDSGKGINFDQILAYSQAFSKTSFYGVQKPFESKEAIDAILKTCTHHYNTKAINRDNLYEFGNEVIAFIKTNRDIAEISYADVIMKANMSSAAIPFGFEGKYRDYVCQHTFEEVMDDLRQGMFIAANAGDRHDRRSKQRLICSFFAGMRVVDTMLNAGMYRLFDVNQGFLKNHSIEGMNISDQFPIMKEMCITGDNLLMGCIDYESFDASFNTHDYLIQQWTMNAHRVHRQDINEMLNLAHIWMDQPKPLVFKTNNVNSEPNAMLTSPHRDVIWQIVIPHYVNLLSGKNMTHSGENYVNYLIVKYLTKIHNMRIPRFWANGDDFNILFPKSQKDIILNVLQDELNFKISIKKSLIGHDLKVWSRKWFTINEFPWHEMGTFRSWLESEKQTITDIVPSKYSSDWGTAANLIRVLLRKSNGDKLANKWLNISKGMGIEVDRIPVELEIMDYSNKPVWTDKPYPKGIDSVKAELTANKLSGVLFGSSDEYELAINSYMKEDMVEIEPKNKLFYPEGTSFRLHSGVDYSVQIDDDLPWRFRNLIQTNIHDNTEIKTARQLINACGGYVKPVNYACHFDNMLSFAHALNERERRAWRKG